MSTTYTVKDGERKTDLILSILEELREKSNTVFRHGFLLSIWGIIITRELIYLFDKFSEKHWKYRLGYILTGRKLGVYKVRANKHSKTLFTEKEE